MSPSKNILCFFYKDKIENDVSFEPQKLPYQDMTHLIWSFVRPNPQAQLVSDLPHLEEEYLNPITLHAHQSGVQVLLAIGGWGNSQDFSKIAQSESLRKTFAHECAYWLQKYDLDGIDIDWEFPGLSEFGGNPSDQIFITPLLQEIRQAIGPTKTLTIDLPGRPEWFQYFPINEFKGVVDFISIMSYDLSSPELAQTQTVWHNSALYDDYQPNHWSWNRLLNHVLTLDFPIEHINLGMAFYGRTYHQQTQIGNSWHSEQHAGVPSAITYQEISALLGQDQYKHEWDSLAKVPYLTSKDCLITYDDERSIALKAQFIHSEGLAGVIIWELNCDQIENSHPLLEAAARLLK